MMTRREAILAGLAIPAWASSASEFWNEKKPADWTDDEVRQLLNKSPWAKDASISYNSGFGGTSARSSSGGSNGRSSRRSSVPQGSPSADPGSLLQYSAVIRWESALPIRQATHRDALADYVVSVSGQIPTVAHRDPDETEMSRQQRLEMLKEFTRLDRRADPIFLSRVEAQGAATWFYFPRREPIKLEDRQITFMTKFGPVEIKAKFPLKEMVYRGKLEL